MTRHPRNPKALHASALGLAFTAILASVPRGTSAAPPAPAASATPTSATSRAVAPATSAPPPSASSRAASAPPASAAATTRMFGSAMSQIAAVLARDLGADVKQAMVCTATLRSDEPAPRGAELAGKMALLLAGKIGGAAKADPVSLATAQAVARRASALVYLQTDVAAGQLRVTADVYRATRNVWERVREPIPAPSAHAFAAGRIDGEVRSYLAPVPLVGARIDRATTEDKDVIAIACGDIDDDGALEIVTMSRRRIAVGRARGGRFVTLRTALLHDFSSVAPSPLREPLGGIAITPSRRGSPHLDIGISDRAHGSRLDGELRLLGAINGVPFATPSGVACMRFQGSTLATTIGKCADGDPALWPTELETPFDAIATGIFVNAQGNANAVDAARDPHTSDVTLRASGRTATLPQAGAQLAIADLDQDGAPEIVSSLDVLPSPQGGADDALVVTTWEADGSLREKSRIPVPTGIHAIAACPPEGRGPAAVAVATPGELWIVR